MIEQKGKHRKNNYVKLMVSDKGRWKETEICYIMFTIYNDNKRKMVSMVFRRKKHKNTAEESIDFHALVLEQLEHMCEEGQILDDAFVLEAQDIYIYADVISVEHNVAQIVFQLHHEWLDDAILESVAASGSNAQEAVTLACEDFYRHTLQLYLRALQGKAEETVFGFTQLRHYFQVYRNEIHGIGKREGLIEQDFWEMLKQKLQLRLGNKKAYWIKVFASKTRSKVLCEVRINGREDSELSELLLPYAQNWDCIGSYHTEKQNFLLIQEERSYEPSDFTGDNIRQYTRKAIKWYEKCGSKEEHRKLREQLIRLCKDDSLAYEIFSFVPEIYCKYAYPKVEYGSRLFLIQKDQKTRELYQSQLQSFSYIEETVMEHLKKDHVNRSIVENVISFSANARAIQKAMDNGDALDELMIPGIGYYARNDYIMR